MKWFSKMNLPNQITVARMFIVLLIVIAALFPYQACNITIPVYTLFGIQYSLTRIIIFWLFVIGSASDFLDGNIARKRHIETVFGKFLDPIADKLLVNVLYLILAVWMEVPVLIVIIFIVRDTVVDAIRLLAMDQKVVIAASKWGKVKTVTQMIAMILVLLYVPYAIWVVYLAGAVSLISGLDYFFKNRHFLLEGADYHGKQ